MKVRLFIKGSPTKEPSATRHLHQVPNVGDTIFLHSAPHERMRCEVLERLWNLYPDRGVHALQTCVDLLVKRVPE